MSNDTDETREAARAANAFYGQGDDVFDEAFDFGYDAALAARPDAVGDVRRVLEDGKKRHDLMNKAADYHPTLCEMCLLIQTLEDSLAASQPVGDVTLLKNWIDEVPQLQKDNAEAERITGDDMETRVGSQPVGDVEAAKVWFNVLPQDSELGDLAEKLIDEGAGVRDLYRLMAAFAASQPSSPPSGWVAIASALPEPYQEIWVTYADGEVDDAIESQNIVCGSPDSDVIAWMPKTKPAPYQVEDSTRPQEDKDGE